jgi:hypothetical protein
MRIIPPFTVTPDELTSNVAITETEWTAGTYATGVERYVGTDLYEVVADPDTADEPVAGAAKDVPTWIKIGKINRFKMFDFIIGEATTRASPVEVTLNFSPLLNAVALFEVEATSVRVVVEDATDGVVYDQEKELADLTGITDWFAYFFAPFAQKSDVIFLDLPSYAGADVKVTITNASAGVSIGEMVVGRTQTIGATLMNFSFGIEDFSRKERDVFGNFTIVERRFAKLANYDVFIDNAAVNPVFLTLAKVRATPVVFVGDENKPETITLGFYRDFSTLRTGPESSEMSIEIEGLV